MRQIPSAVVTIFLACAGWAPAQAAPQALLLVAGQDGVPLSCGPDGCVAEATTLCLQPDRSIPLPGTHYAVLNAATPKATPVAWLEGRGPDGAPRRVDLPASLRIASARGHTAVRVTMPADAPEVRGLADLRLRFNRSATLVPVALPGDSIPQTPAEIALADGPQRALADRVLARHGGSLEGALAVRRMINSLPRLEAPTRAQRSSVFATALRLAASPRGKAEARKAFDQCGGVGSGAHLPRQALFISYRACLGIAHDGLIKDLNHGYWNALKSGS